MRKLSYVFLFSALMLLLPMPSICGGEFKLEPGFTLLFNGKNLDGWRQKSDKAPLEGKTEAYNGRFKVVDGRLVYDLQGQAFKGESLHRNDQGIRQGRPHQARFQAGPQMQQRLLPARHQVRHHSGQQREQERQGRRMVHVRDRRQGRQGRAQDQRRNRPGAQGCQGEGEHVRTPRRVRRHRDQEHSRQGVALRAP